MHKPSMTAQCVSLGVLLILSAAMPARGSAALRDPTRPALSAAADSATRPAPRQALHVQMIRVQGGTALAVINQRTVRVGDELEGVTVVRIDANAVQVRDSNGLRSLPLLNTPPKKLSGSTGS